MSWLGSALVTHTHMGVPFLGTSFRVLSRGTQKDTKHLSHFRGPPLTQTHVKVAATNGLLKGKEWGTEVVPWTFAARQSLTSQGPFEHHVRPVRIGSSKMARNVIKIPCHGLHLARE